MEKSKQYWEQEFITSLIRLRDLYTEQEPMEIVGPKNAKVIESLIAGYFCERRHNTHIQEVSFYMNFEDMVIFINDIVLDYVKDEHPGFLDVNWQQMYILKSKIEDSFFNDEDKEDYY